MSKGVIRSIRDLVVKVEFVDDPPEIGEIITCNNDEQTPLLVNSFVNDTTALCLNLYSQFDIHKGMTVEKTGRGIEIPVGEKTIGRILGAMGQPLDNKPAPQTDQFRSITKKIHRSTDFTPAKPEILETGIKVIDFFTPFVNYSPAPVGSRQTAD